MLAATLADVDGLGILVSEELYWQLHHALGHCLLFGVAVLTVLAAFSKHRVLAFVVYLALFHLHLMLDYFGSGPHWPLHYFWPFSRWAIENPNAWPFFSWQNLSAFGALFIWTIVILRFQRRSPLEWPMPRLDAKLVAILSPSPKPRPSHRTSDYNGTQ